MTKAVHLVKTGFGGPWALWQVEVLRKCGVEVTVLLPPGESRNVPGYEACGCKVIRFDFQSLLREPWKFAEGLRDLRRIIERESPDIVHSHFYITTLLMRLAFRDDGSLPRVFQVAGPLHLEHRAFKELELRLAGEKDYWIASSRCIAGHYIASGVPRERLYLSYHGIHVSDDEQEQPKFLRGLLGLGPEDIVVGNVCWMYAPKYYLGQTKGLKRHEDMIDALGILIEQDPRVKGVFVGGGWNLGADRYERSLRSRARRVAGDGILFTGPMPSDRALLAWPDYDVAIHVPISENAGGVVEPLYFRVPTIASNVGALPEVVIEGKTGYLVPPRDPAALAKRIAEVISDLDGARKTAENGRLLVRRMFDIERTGREILSIYEHILDPGKPRPEEFDSRAFVDENIAV